MGLLGKIKSIFKPDYNSFFNTAENLKKKQGAKAVVEFLEPKFFSKDGKFEISNNIESHQKDSYVKCIVLLASCLAETGRLTEGLETLRDTMKKLGYLSLIGPVAETVLKQVLSKGHVKIGEFLPHVLFWADVCLKTGKVDISDRICQMGLNVFRNNSELRLIHANILTSHGNIVGAVDILHKIIEVEPAVGERVVESAKGWLQVANQSVDTQICGSIQSVLGRALYVLNKFQEALPHLETARSSQGDKFEEARTLLGTYARLNNVVNFLSYSETLLNKKLSEDIVTYIAAESISLIVNHPDNAVKLQLLVGVCQLHNRHYQEAVKAFSDVIVRNKTLSTEVLSWYEKLVSDKKENTVLCLGMAQAMEAAGMDEDCFKMLLVLEGLKSADDQLETMSSMLERMVSREQPEQVNMRHCLERLLFRQNDLKGALREISIILKKPGQASLVIDLCEQIIKATSGKDEEKNVRIATFKLMCEAVFMTHDLTKAVLFLNELAEIDVIAKDDLEWCQKKLHEVIASGQEGAQARVILGNVLHRMGQDIEGIHEYAIAITPDTPESVLKIAAAGLKEVLEKIGDHADGCLALTKAYLFLQNPEEARAFALDCIVKHKERSRELLETIVSLLRIVPPSTKLLRLVVEVEVASGDELRMEEAVVHGEELLQNDKQTAPFVYEQCQLVVSRCQNEDIKGAALLLGAKALLSMKQFKELAEHCLSFLYFPNIITEVIPILEQATKKTDKQNSARLFLTIGRIYASSGARYGDKAVENFSYAAEAGISETGEEVIRECRDLALAENGYIPAIFLASRTATQIQKGPIVMSDFLRLLDQCQSEHFPELLECAQAVLRQTNECSEARLVVGRTQSKLGNILQSRQAYEELIKFSDKTMLTNVLQDLDALKNRYREDAEIWFLLTQVYISLNNTKSAREILVDRAKNFPVDAEGCACRLQTIVDRNDSTWEDSIALGEVLIIHGKQDDGLRVLRDTLGNEKACKNMLEIVRSVCSESPEDLNACGLLVSVLVRVLPHNKLSEPMDRLEKILADSTRIPCKKSLTHSLDDCKLVLDRAKEQEGITKQALYNQARILELMCELDSSALTLEDLIQRWPGEHEKVKKICEKAITTQSTPAFYFPLARAHVAADESQTALDILQKVSDSFLQATERTEQLCEVIAGLCKGEMRINALLLRANMLGKLNRSNTAAEVYLLALKEEPSVFDSVKKGLTSLIDKEPGNSELYFYLASAEISQGVPGVSSACDVLEHVLIIDVAKNTPRVCSFLDNMREKFTHNLEIEICSLYVTLKQVPETYQKIVDEAREICSSFKRKGAKAVVDFCDKNLNQTIPEIPLWYLKSDTQRILNDISGCLVSLGVIKQLALCEEKDRIKQRLGILYEDAKHDPVVVTFMADLARDTGEYEQSAMQYAEVLELQGHDLEYIGTSLKTLQGVNSANPAILSALARYEWLSKRPDSAAVHYREAFKLKPLTEIEDWLDRLCESFPELPISRFVFGEVLFKNQKFQEALKNLEHALSLGDLSKENDVLSYKYMCECYVSLGQYNKAIESIIEACRLVPDDNEAADRLLSIHFAECSYRIKQLESEIIEKGEREKPLFQLAMALKERGDYEAAAEKFQQVSSCGKVFIKESLLELGKCQMALNQCNLSVINFKKILSNCDDIDFKKDVLYQLGTAYTHLLLFREAVEVFEQVCAIDSAYRDASECLRKAYQNSVVGETFFLAEIPFDLLRVWRKLTKDKIEGKNQEG